MKVSKDTKLTLAIILFFTLLITILWVTSSCQKSSPDCDVDHTGAIELANKTPYDQYFEVLTMNNGSTKQILLTGGESTTLIIPTGTTIVYTTDTTGYNAHPQMWVQEVIHIKQCKVYPYAKTD
jgi:hypothetical protein